MRLALASPSQAMTCEGMCFQKSTWYWANGYLPPHLLGRWRRAPVGGWSFHKLGKPIFQLTQPDIDYLEREAEVLTDFFRLLGESGIRTLPRVHQRFLFSEHHRCQPGVSVESQAGHHCSIEVAYEPVGQKKRAG